MAKAQERTITLVRPPDDRGVFVFCIQTKRDTSFYVAQQIPCQIGGTGYAVHRLGFGELLHVRVGSRADCSCECLGFLRHGHCRHVSGLLALRRHQRLT